MSRAASTLPMWARIFSDLAWHPSAKCLLMSTSPCSSAVSSGEPSYAISASRSLSERQCTGVLVPTPRGSKPTMSYTRSHARR